LQQHRRVLVTILGHFLSHSSNRHRKENVVPDPPGNIYLTKAHNHIQRRQTSNLHACRYS
jgi:hypothetical protein